MVTNERYVFMAHVSSSLARNRRLNIFAENYLQRVLTWMQEHGDGRIQVGLVANGLEDPTIGVFRAACAKYDCNPNSNLKSGSCCSVGFDHHGNLMLDNADISLALPFDIIGTAKRPDLIVSRIDASDYGFGEAWQGDLGEALEDIMTRLGWEKSPALFRAVESMVKLIYEKTGEVRYGYVGELLNRIDREARVSGGMVTGRNFIDICNELTISLDRMATLRPPVEMEREIRRVVRNTIPEEQATVPRSPLSTLAYRIDSMRRHTPSMIGRKHPRVEKIVRVTDVPDEGLNSPLKPT